MRDDNKRNQEMSMNPLLIINNNGQLGSEPKLANTTDGGSK